jgi:hypothetical protein
MKRTNEKNGDKVVMAIVEPEAYCILSNAKNCYKRKKSLLDFEMR